MEKDNHYWNIHKQVWNELLSELDTDVVMKIYDKPNSTEGKLFTRQVDKEVKNRLQLQAD